MPTILLYFQVHQPNNLMEFSFFNSGSNTRYLDDTATSKNIKHLAEACYIPANRILLEQIKRHEGRFKVAFGISGIMLESLATHAPEVIDSFREMAKTGCVEFLCMPYYHSLSSIFSSNEFKEELISQRKTLEHFFNCTPTVVMNTGLIYNDRIGAIVEEMGLKGILIEGTEIESPEKMQNRVYKAHGTRNVKIIPRHYRLSDDIALRFHDKGWDQYPLTAAGYVSWLAAMPNSNSVISIGLNYETFGTYTVHHSDILKFLESLPGEGVSNPQIRWRTPGEVVNETEATEELSFHAHISWAGYTKDLTPWLGSRIQFASCRNLYDIENHVKASKIPGLIECWRKLGDADYLHYIKWPPPEATKTNFRKWEKSYDLFITYMNILRDIKRRANMKRRVLSTQEKKKKELKPDAYKTPSEYNLYFFLCNDRVISSPAELVEELETMDDDVFQFHVNKEKNDFTNWLRDVFELHELATSLQRTRSKTGMIRAINRYFSI